MMLTFIKQKILLLLILSFPSFLSAAASVSGQITDSTTGSPINGALVEVLKGNVVQESDTTDALGFYQITGVNPGQVNIRVTTAGYQIRVVGARLSNNQETIVNIALEPIVGTIFGTVIDAVSSIPLAGVRMDIYQGTVIYQTTFTDVNGQYSVTELFPDSYTVVASASGYQDAIEGAIVSEGEVEIVNFALSTILGSVTGQVIDAASTLPIPNATVSIIDESEIIASTQTDINGNYSISGLPPGNLTVIASSDGYETKFTGVTITAGTTSVVNFALIPNPGTLQGRVINNSTGNPIQGASISIFQGSVLITSAFTDANGLYEIDTLAPGTYTVRASAHFFQFVLEGTIIISEKIAILNFKLNPLPGTIIGTVVDAVTASPIVGATIRLLDGPDVIATVLTDPNGRYLMTGIASGIYIIQAHSLGYQISLASMKVSSDAASVQNFALIKNPGTLSGTVFDSSSLSPISGATINVYDSSTLIASSITDVNGNYTISDLPPGTYDVVALAQTYADNVTQAIIIANATTILDFPLSQDFGSMTGFVTNRCDNQPIAGVIILVFSQGHFVNDALTDGNGQYEIDGLAPGPYSLVARKQGFVTVSATANVVTGSFTSLNFVLDPILLPPQSIKGNIKHNKFLTKEERVKVISWKESPSGCLQGYQIFKDGQLVDTVSVGDPLVFYDRCTNKKGKNTYQVRAVDNFGLVSEFVTIIL